MMSDGRDTTIVKLTHESFPSARYTLGCERVYLLMEVDGS